MMWYGGGGPGWGGWLVMSLSMLVFWGLLIWAIVAFVRWAGSSSSGAARGSQPETPEQILARRFASGEIDRDEYRAALDELHARRPAGV